MTEWSTSSEAASSREMAAVSNGELGPLLASTKNCDVYALGDEHVLKLYPQTVPLNYIRREATVTRLVHEAGLPSPGLRLQPIRNVDSGRFGIVYQRIEGRTMSRTRRRNPLRTVQLAGRFAAVHLHIHSFDSVPGLPSLRERVNSKLAQAGLISSEQRARLQQIFDALPDGTATCHGDFHHSNLILGTRGEATAIDWGDATVGPAAWDVARSLVLARFKSRPKQPLAMILDRWFANVYLAEYRKISPLDEQELRDWILVNVAIRLGEKCPALEQRWLSDYLAKHL